MLIEELKSLITELERESLACREEGDRLHAEANDFATRSRKTRISEPTRLYLMAMQSARSTRSLAAHDAAAELTRIADELRKLLLELT